MVTTKQKQKKMCNRLTEKVSKESKPMIRGEKMTYPQS